MRFLFYIELRGTRTSPGGQQIGTPGPDTTQHARVGRHIPSILSHTSHHVEDTRLRGTNNKWKVSGHSGGKLCRYLGVCSSVARAPRAAASP